MCWLSKFLEALSAKETGEKTAILARHRTWTDAAEPGGRHA
ncbi:MAG: hypothetical protein WCI12_00065 [Actinomycetes bacterium]